MTADRWEPLHRLVAAQAARTPTATAIVADERRVSYAELEARANRLAHHLRGLGVRADTIVGVCLERGVDLVVALLAVWRAGGAYLPLDPGHPADRLARLRIDAGAEILLTHNGLAEGSAGTVVRVDEHAAEIAACPDVAPTVAVEPTSAAYAIYTSGSTGRPKGVVVTQAGIANRVCWTVREHGLSTSDRVLQKTSIAFDAAGWEFFAPLISGGTVVLAAPGAERDPAAVVRAVNEHQVTVLQGVPSVLRSCVDQTEWADCGSLRLVFSAGEPLYAPLARELAAPGEIEVWNTYGPTECSIDVTAHRVDPEQLTGPIPIGRPIDGIQVLVLDAAGDPVPIGVVGELHIGGVGLARGYLGQPARTAERFVPLDLGAPGARYYRTGDQVRWRTDGTLEYVGRDDAQFKVNGVRIEPGEIEVALVEHPDVHGAVVVKAGEDRLAAYVRGARTLQSSALREHLAARLPQAFIPSVFAVVAEFPLTASGKVDRAKLPPLDKAVRPDYVAPRTEAERIIAEEWQELLGVERIGVHDDFFALGGSSLVLTRLANRINARATRKVPLRGLFTAATVAAQAELLGMGHDADAVPVRPVGRDAPLPLSFGQRRLWFLDQMRPGSPEWVAPVFFRLPEDVPVAAVQQALDALEARHEALRTRYLAEEGEPQQVIAPAAPVELRVVDRESEVDGLVELFGEQFARGFDLREGPLWRAMLVRIPGRRHVLLLTLHHITSDGWTATVLERDLRELTAAFTAGREPLLPALPVQYADYAVWQREQLTTEVLDRELAYWRDTLADLPRLDLPVDRRRPPVRDARGSGVRVELSAELTESLAALGKRCGATPFMTLLTGFAALLARHTGQWDVPIGTPVAGRGRPETENVAGFFLNSLVLRCRLDPDLTFEEAVRHTRETAALAFAHDQMPFERLVDELAGERDLSRTPLYQAAFDLQDEGATGGQAADPVSADAFQRAWRIAKTDLTLFVWRRANGSMTGAFEYATSIFDRETVERLSEHFVRLLAAVAADPAASLGDVDFLGEPERAQLVSGWNDTRQARDGRTVLDEFEQQVSRCPNAIAVQTPSATLTYAELDDAANRLAHALVWSGVGRGDTVGILLERGRNLPAALLAAWKAGAAYAPIDPSWPDERVAAALTAGGVTALITPEAHADRFDRPVVRLEADGRVPGPETVGPPPRQTALDELAYVIFTSGSTGQPKGVQVTHRGVANHIRWAADTLAARGMGGAPLFSSTAFDLVVPNLWAPLVTGQRLFVVPTDLELTKLGSTLVAADRFSFIKLTPAHLELLESQLDDYDLASLAEVIVVAGEALPPELANRWLTRLGPGGLINEYGPTEATVGTSVFPIHGRQSGERVPIGGPLPNMTMHVCDERMHPAPVGVAGELYVGGEGVARGYANHPARTAERFVPDPFGPAGGRLYRTGDRVRRLPDGSVDFLGRFDDQVKIRGYRIELGDVRTAVESHPAVRAAAVITDGQRLIAYHVGDAADLVEHCAKVLPTYLMPDMFVPLDALPLNANGKVDRRALPSPDVPAAPSRPLNAAEQRVADVWLEVLGRVVGAEDNFFGHGGNSILGIQLIALLQEEFDLDIPVRVLFEQPTVAGLAGAVEELIRQEVAALPEDELEESQA